MGRKIIESSIEKLRDPFILYDNGTYYMYGTDWICYKNTSGDLSKNWEYLGQVVNPAKDTVDQKWAPEVYKINGKYFMITTYFSAKTQHRGCAVFSSILPEGPFELYSDGHITPKEWDCIDGTLYFDENSQPYMVFVHEWISMPDKVGTMAVAKMSADLRNSYRNADRAFQGRCTRLGVYGHNRRVLDFQNKRGQTYYDVVKF